jgi:hypothetical protein
MQRTILSIRISSVTGSWDSSVGIATDYRLDDREIEVRFSAGERNSSLLHSVQTGFGAHSASYTMGTGGLFPWGQRGSKDLYLALRSRMVELLIPPSPYVFTGRCLIN